MERIRFHYLGLFAAISLLIMATACSCRSTNGDLQDKFNGLPKSKWAEKRFKQVSYLPYELEEAKIFGISEVELVLVAVPLQGITPEEHRTYILNLDSGQIRPIPEIAEDPYEISERSSAFWITIDNQKSLVVFGVGYYPKLFEVGTSKWMNLVSNATIGVDDAGVFTQLHDDTILAAGGFANPSYCIKRYYPLDKAWREIKKLSVCRKGHSITTLKDGRALIAGGVTEDREIIRHVSRIFEVTNSCEVYDPTNNRVSKVSSMRTARGEHASCLLTDGRVLVVGGRVGHENWTRSVEIYDPVKDEWFDCMPIPEVRWKCALIPLSDGNAMVVGGYAPDESHFAPFDTLIFNSKTLGWEKGPSLEVFETRSLQHGIPTQYTYCGKKLVIRHLRSIQVLEID